MRDDTRSEEAQRKDDHQCHAGRFYEYSDHASRVHETHRLLFGIWRQPINIEGVAALVTGAGRRIGRAIATALAEEGAKVAVHYLNSKSDALETAEGIKAFGGSAAIFQADLQDADAARDLARRVDNELGPIRILINSASLFARGSFEKADIAEWDRYMNTNVRAGFILAQAMWLGLPEDTGGKIINIGDWRRARANRFCYGISKQALFGLTRSLALAMSPKVQVNELALGAILQPADAVGEPVGKAPGPAGRTGTLNEVTSAVTALIDNDFITGETLILDGGDHIR